MQRKVVVFPIGKQAFNLQAMINFRDSNVTTIEHKVNGIIVVKTLV